MIATENNSPKVATNGRTVFAVVSGVVTAVLASLLLTFSVSAYSDNSSGQDFIREMTDLETYLNDTAPDDSDDEFAHIFGESGEDEQRFFDGPCPCGLH